MMLFEIMMDLPMYLYLIVSVSSSLSLAWNLLCLRLKTTHI